MEQINAYNQLISKIDAFIRKYYLNQLLKGSLYLSALLLAIFLLITTSEYFFHFSSSIRSVLLWGFISSALVLGIRYFVIPLSKFLKLGKVISHEEAASIIGKHFPDVKDKMLNLLQLKQMSANSNSVLVEASIDQKMNELKPVPIQRAINLMENKKYARYLIIPSLFLLIILVASPNLLKESTSRLINANVKFEDKAPFDFIIENGQLEVLQYEDFTLNVLMKGNVLPSDVYIYYGGMKQKLDRRASNKHAFVIRRMQKDISFTLNADGYKSKEYLLKVRPKAVITDFKVDLHFPSYTGKSDLTIKNNGDLSVPAGTVAEWVFETANASDLNLVLLDSNLIVNRLSSQLFHFKSTLKKAANYDVYIHGTQAGTIDTISYQINVVPDRYPEIFAEAIQDSLEKKFMYFIGRASDDYGLRSLQFQVQITRTGTKKPEIISHSLPMSAGLSQDFKHYLDVSTLKLEPGDKAEYYFIVWDNDMINGSKSTRVAAGVISLPDAKEFKKKNEKRQEKIKSGLSETVSESQKLKEELKSLQNDLAGKKKINWEDKEKIKDLMDRQSKIEQQVQELKKEFDEQIEEEDQFTKKSEEIAKKQEELQKLFEELLDEETKALMEKLEEMMDEMNRETALEELEDMEFNEDQLSKELDRMLELMKQLEFEQKLNESIDELNKLADDQEKLSEETEAKEEPAEELAKKQEDLNERFEDIKEDLADLEKLNEELEDQKNMENSSEKQSEISEEMQNSSESLEKSKNQKASEQQKSAAGKMKEMAESMESMKNQDMADQMEQDMKSIRQILENLVKLSKDQESLMDRISRENVNHPAFKDMVQEQHRLKEDAKMVEDSLYALSRRMASISSYVNEEIGKVNKNLKQSIELLEDRKTANAGNKQQFVMTSENNLALMLSEVMEQMQQQMAQMQPGNQNCENPGNKPGSKAGKMPGMKKMQEQLNKQLSEMQQMMKDGQKPNGEGKGGKEMKRKMAESAAKQAAIRDALQKYNKENNKDGKGSLGDLEELAKQMEETETELYNKQLTQEMITRQQDILTRLLEAEEAEKERDTEDQRESETATDFEHKAPPSFEQYLQQRNAEIEFYKTLPPNLKPFYKELVEKYFKTISFN